MTTRAAHDTERRHEQADAGEMDYLDKRIVRLAERKRKAQDNLGALRAATAETIKYGDWR